MDDGFPNDYLVELKKRIAKHGWVVQGVFPTRDTDPPPFAYTIGLTIAGLPELIVSGLAPNQAEQVITVAASVHLGEELLPGTTTNDVITIPMRIMDAPRATLGFARKVCGRNTRAVQLVWPDKDGDWPKVRSDWQELFGEPWW